MMRSSDKEPDVRIVHGAWSKQSLSLGSTANKPGKRLRLPICCLCPCAVCKIWSKQLRLSPILVPPELIGETIDYLWDNKDALVACSFVYRLFYLRTRMHLFQSTELKHTSNDEPSSKNVLPHIRKIIIRWGSDIPILIFAAKPNCAPP